MLSIMRSGVVLLKGYSVAGAERRRVEVVGFGFWMVGEVGELLVCSGRFLVRVPVRAAEGRICSKPWEAATFSMDLKYCLRISQKGSEEFNLVWGRYRTFTVLTCNSRVASSSTTSIGCGWSWRLERVHM